MTKMRKMKAMILLTFIIHPFPPEDFGTLVDSLSLSKPDHDYGMSKGIGIGEDGFLLFSRAILGRYIVTNATEVSYQYIKQ
jgi:hypothetical protein